MFSASHSDGNSIFSTNSTLVTHSDGVITRYSASPNRTNGNLQNDLITFLSIVQKCDVGYLPITWQPALSTLGVGGSGTISQSTLIPDMPLAFKRFHHKDNSKMDFLPLMSEVLILSQPPIQSNSNIVNLEGICWEINRNTEIAVPVLVFEKAAWDLHQFMNVSEGMNMSIDDRFKLCADIGSAVMALHAYGVIHGDIKPQNVLVFKDTTGKTTAKVTDFGYSTIATGEEGRVFLPKSRPWNAPEHHFGEFKALEARKTDVYSFGMLCMWILFRNSLSNIRETTAEGELELLSFNAPLGRRTLLERLKDDDKMETIAYQLIESMQGLSTEHIVRLKELFGLMVPLDPEKRTTDLERLVCLLSQERTENQLLPTRLLETTSEFSCYIDFKISKNLGDFVLADYRVRTQIEDCLEKNYIRNRNQPFAANIAFQVAFCYQIGFGVKSDAGNCHTWLQKCDKLPEYLETERETVRPARLKSERITEHGLIPVNLIHEYRSWGLNKLKEARKQYEREIDDMTRGFGELHFIPIALCSIFGDLLDEFGEFGISEALRTRIRDQTEKTSGINHPSTLASMANLASTYRNQGRWKEVTELLVKVMETRKRVFGQEHPDTLISMTNLASIYGNQGRWKETEVLEAQVIETRKRILGQEHPYTLTSMGNLASTYRNQGRWTEAEELLVQVMETGKRVLGEEHPNTLISMGNLASTYKYQGRWKETEVLEVQVMETTKRVLGQEHPDTLTSMGNLATTYKYQGRWKEAEELLVQAMETRKRVFGQEHPNTLTSMGNLALTYSNLGRWTKAEELEVQVMETRKRVLGQEHPNTLTSMSNLASIYRNQGRLKETEVLELQVLETRKRVLGQDHPGTLTSMGNLALTYSNQRRWTEAEVLEVQVMETRKRVFGQEHPDTLTSMANLASTYNDQGRWKETEELEVQVLETSKRVLGQEHPDTLTSMGNLASTYRNQGRWKEAEVLEVQVLETSKRVLGQDHPDTLTSMGNLASTYKYQGRWKETEVLEVQVMEMRKRILGQEHPDTLASMANLAITYKHQGRWKEAKELQIQAVNRLRTTLGEDHPCTVVAIANLASMRTKHTAPQHFSDVRGSKDCLPDKLQQFVPSRSLNEGNLGQERLQRTSTILQKSDEDNDLETDEEKIQCALAISLEVDDDNDSDEKMLQRALAMSIEADEDDETQEERLQSALSMSSEADKDSDKKEERHQRALDNVDAR